MPDITPDDVISAGAGLAARARLEESISAVVGDELSGFAEQVRSLASQAAAPGRISAFTFAAVTALWVGTLDRIQDRLAPKIGAAAAGYAVEELRSGDGAVPNAAFRAGSEALSTGAAAGLSATAIRRNLSRFFGLTPADEYRGRFTADTPLGRTSFSWEKAGEAAARTSSTRAAATAMIEKLRAEGYTHKRWMTRYDSRVRDSHANVDRTTVELDASFTVGGSSLRYPADPYGPLAEIVNCRCLIVGVRFGRHALDHPEGTEPWNDPRPAS